MWTRFGRIVVVIGLVSSARAESNALGAPADPRQQVIDWLCAAGEYEFVGVLEFEKQMSLPADPSRALEAEELRRRGAEETSRLTDRAGRSPEHNRIGATDGERLISQIQEAEAFFRNWSSNRTRVVQHWRVVYFSPDEMRVEFASSSAALPVTSSLPMVRINARSAGETWSWTGLVPGDKTVRAPVHFDRSDEFVRQGRREMGRILQDRFSVLDEEHLVNATRVGDRLVARFSYAHANNFPEESITLTFDWMDAALRLRSSESVNGERYVRNAYDDYRDVDGRAIPFAVTHASGPIQEHSLAVNEVRHSNVHAYQISRIDLGVTSAFERLLEKPVCEPGDRRSYKDISPTGYAPFLTSTVASRTSKPEQ